MGPYCNFCAQRCFVLRKLRDGRSMLLATCARGMEHDRQEVGEDHTTAINPAVDLADVQADWIDRIRDDEGTPKGPIMDRHQEFEELISNELETMSEIAMDHDAMRAWDNGISDRVREAMNKAFEIGRNLGH